MAVAVSAVLLYLSFRGADWNQMLATLRNGSPSLLLIAGSMLLVSYFVRGLRWRVILSARTEIGPIRVFWASSIGYLFNNILPARAGEVVRSLVVARETRESRSYVFATALIERIVDVVALALVGVVAILLDVSMPPWLLLAAKGMAVAGTVGVFVILLAPRIAPVVGRVIRALPLPSRLRKTLIRLLEQFLLGMRALLHPRRAARFVALTTLIWVIDAAMAVQVATALQLSLAFPEALLLLAALGLASAAPSTPGYIGVYQFAAVTVLPAFGFTQADALAYIIAFQALSYVIICSTGALGVWAMRAVMPTGANRIEAGASTADAAA